MVGLDRKEERRNGGSLDRNGVEGGRVRVGFGFGQEG